MSERCSLFVVLVNLYSFNIIYYFNILTIAFSVHRLQAAMTVIFQFYDHHHHHHHHHLY